MIKLGKTYCFAKFKTAKEVCDHLYRRGIIGSYVGEEYSNLYWRLRNMSCRIKVNDKHFVTYRKGVYSIHVKFY